MKADEILKALGIELTEEQKTKLAELNDDKEEKMVPKSRLDKVIEERNEYKSKMDDLQKQFKDVEPLQKQLGDFQEKIVAMEKEKEAILKKNSIKEVASKFKARDIEDLMKFIDDSKLKIENDTISGLEEQVKELAKNKAYLFEVEETKPQLKGATPVVTGQTGTKPVYTKEMLSTMSPEDINKNWAEISKQLGNI